MKTSVALLTLSLVYLSVAEAVRSEPCQNSLGYLVAKLVDAKIKELRKEILGTRVAFGAAMGNVGNVGPYGTNVNLIYKKVFTNTGSFNPHTGFFTAPVKGVYYFSFSGHNFSSRSMGLRLMKNGKQVVIVYNHAAGRRHETATNGMTLQLNVGDRVNMGLFAHTWVFDNINTHTTFIGHLLFPL